MLTLYKITPTTTTRKAAANMVTEVGRRLLERWIYVMVKVGEEFVCPYTPERLQRVREDPAYPREFETFLARFMDTLGDEPGWQPGSYYPGGWFRVLEKQGADPLEARMDPGALAPFTMEEALVDARGRWTVGEKRIEGRILDHFLRNLHFDVALQRYRIHYWLEKHYETRYLHHQSPPFRVRRVERRGSQALLSLNDGTRESLRTETLRMDRRERLFCAVKPEEVPAWFEEEARWTLLHEAEEQDGRLVLSMNGQVVELTPGGGWPYNDRLIEDQGAAPGPA